MLAGQWPRNGRALATRRVQYRRCHCSWAPYSPSSVKMRLNKQASGSKPPSALLYGFLNRPIANGMNLGYHYVT